MNQFLTKSKIILLCSLTLFTIIYSVNKIYNYKYIHNDNTVIKGYVKSKKDNKFIINNYQVISKKRINVNIGDYVLVKGKTSEPSVNTNFNLFNYTNYLLSKKINYIFYVDKISIIKRKKSFKNNFINYVNSINNEYLSTLILGDNQIDEKELNVIKTNGITHLFAISGMHISLISITFLFVLNKISKKKKLNYFIVSILLVFYASLTTLSPSIIRSVLLFICLTINNKKFKNIEILYLIFIIMLIYNPFYIYDLGFLYSFINSFFLIYFKPKTLFKTSLLAFLASMPITVNSCNSINILSPILNIIYVPFITYIIFPICFIVLLMPKVNIIFKFFINILTISNNFFYKYKLLLIIKTLSPVLILIYYIFLILYLKKKFKYLFIILFIYLNIRCTYYPVVTMLDVGQGDSILIELPFYQGTVLIDTGGSKYTDINKYTLSPYLRSRGIKKIDYLILTHGDYDHIGASIELLKNYKIKNIIMNSYENNELEKKIKHNKIYHFSKNKIDINGNIFYFLNTINSSENEDSLIIYTVLNNYKFLFMGDATIKEEDFILKNYKLDNIDFLKVGHHGSKSSTSKYFIDNIKPSYALISVGLKNIYNHPNGEVINILNKCKIYKTSTDGSIEINLKKRLEILTCR